MKALLFVSMGFSLTIASALAAGGRTADGCSYQIINGQYLTTCGKSAAAAPAPVQVASVSSAPAPVTESTPTNYATVPMRYEPSAPRPSIQQSSIQPETMPVRIITPRNKILGQEEESWQEARAHEHQDLLDSTYVALNLGATTMNSVSAGSALGLGASVGSNIDDTLGFEIGYAYSSQDLNLRLSSRGQADPLATSSYARNSDATLRSHLITGEMQAHLTNSFKRFRPYVGAGLGWKASSLEENSTSSATGYELANNSINGGTLRQSTLGGIGSAGLKFRVSRAINFGATFRYFLPLLRQESKLEQSQSSLASGYGIYSDTTRLTRADEALTGSGQYQIFGGLQYMF